MPAPSSIATPDQPPPVAPAFRFAALFSIGAWLLLGTACAPTPTPVEEPVRSVKVMTVLASAFESRHEFAAEVKPRVESRLGFRVAGKLLQRRVDVGQRVKAGQLLAEIDAQDFQLAAEAAKAQVAAAQTSRDLALAEQRRYASLKEQNFISGAELERRDAALKGAQAQFEQAQAQLDMSSNQARYTRLLADMAGVVTAVEAEPGQMLLAGATVLRLAQDGARDVVFAVPEDKLPWFRLGAAVNVRDWSGGRQLTGKLREIAPSADPVTRTFAIKVALDQGDLALGSTVYVEPVGMGATGQQVIKLPTSALRQQGQGSAVWLLDPVSMTVQSRSVSIATADGNEAVVSGGLAPGMLVVAAGVHVLAPGQKVAIYQDRRAQGAAGLPGAAASAAASK
jgi:multidrug efflux system membrane fusion protein